jgi:hypothetical protein
MAKGPKPAELRLSKEERNELEALVRRHSTPQHLAKRGCMILGAADGKRNAQIAREQGANVDTVRKWRMRLPWVASRLPRRPLTERPLSRSPTFGTTLPDHGRTNLSDDRSGLRTTKRTSHQPVDGARNCRRSDGARDGAQDLCPTCCSRVQKKDLQPHLIRYWLTPPTDPQKDETIRAICMVYHQALALVKQGERTVSTDEQTGVQAAYAQAPRLAAGSWKRRAARV